MNPGWMHSAKGFQSLMQNVTLPLADRYLNHEFFYQSKTEQSRCLDQIVGLIEDRHPDETLRITARYPLPLFQSVFTDRPLSPQWKWRELARGLELLPAPVAKRAKILGIAAGTLPTWAKIRAYFKAIGFEAIPVRGYVGSPTYFHMIASGRIPVCTNWVHRYKGQPYYYAPTDALHDLGHGLALAMPDYRECFVSWAQKAIRTRGYLSSRHLDYHFGRLFEFAYAYDAETGDTVPIGSAAMVFETVRLYGGKIRPVLRETKNIRKQTAEFRAFPTRAAWEAETRAFLKKMERKTR